MGAYTGDTVVFTGTLEQKTRTQASEFATSAGAKVTTTISKNTTIVVAGKDAGSKLDKAKALNVKVMTETEFFAKKGAAGGRAAATPKTVAVKAPQPPKLKAAATPKKTATAASSLSGKHIVFTGTLDTKRGDATALATAAGAIVHGSVSGNTDIVVAGAQAGSKLDKAKEKGIAIMTEKEFLAATSGGGDKKRGAAAPAVVAPPAAKRGKKDTTAAAGAVDPNFLAKITKENPNSKPRNEKEGKEILATAAKINGLVSQMKTLLKDVHKETLDSLEKGCTLKELEAFEKSSGGVSLPWDFKCFLLQVGGQKNENNFLLGQHMLPLKHMKTNADMWNGLVADGTFDDNGPEDEDDENIQQVWWANGWIPFTSDCAGQHYCVDMVPGRTGVEGQIVYMDHECGPSSTDYSNFTEVLEKMVEGLESGELQYNEEYEGLDPEFW